MTRPALAVVLWTACGGGALTPPPPPLRPEPPAAPPVAEPVDCEAIEPGTEEPSKTYAQRAASISEAEQRATAAVRLLKEAESVDVDPTARAVKIAQAVDEFLAALSADPYNITATYNVAAAYARIGRKQCSLNFLERLIQMRSHPSRTDEVEGKLDRLLGRNRQTLDPDFNDLRIDADFRRMVEQICSSGGPACE